MSRPTRILVAIAAILMSTAYVFPLWRISLVAPQYPEGLGMKIRINDIVGIKEMDLQNINGLNHYIGMKTIVPESIPELRFMPAILGVLIATGLGVAAWGRKWPLYGWSLGLAAVLGAGFVDYWRWGYDYGHNLDPHAIITIPGMSYQPPLLGSKQLLNFTATSWPDLGGWALVVATALVAAAISRSLFQKTSSTA